MRPLQVCSDLTIRCYAQQWSFSWRINWSISLDTTSPIPPCKRAKLPAAPIPNLQEEIQPYSSNTDFSLILVQGNPIRDSASIKIQSSHPPMSQIIPEDLANITQESTFVKSTKRQRNVQYIQPNMVCLAKEGQSTSSEMKSYLQSLIECASPNPHIHGFYPFLNRRLSNPKAHSTDNKWTEGKWNVAMKRALEKSQLVQFPIQQPTKSIKTSQTPQPKPVIQKSIHPIQNDTQVITSGQVELYTKGIPEVDNTSYLNMIQAKQLQLKTNEQVKRTHQAYLIYQQQKDINVIRRSRTNQKGGYNQDIQSHFQRSGGQDTQQATLITYAQRSPHL